MYDFIVEYWVQFIFGLAAACIVWVIKEYYKSREKVEDMEEKNNFESIEQRIEEDLTKKMDELMNQISLSFGNMDKRLDSLTEKLDANTEGTLRIYKNLFYKECNDLLEKGHEITFDEWTKVFKDYNIYKKMDGNDIGDVLYGQVSEKYKNQQQK